MLFSLSVFFSRLNKTNFLNSSTHPVHLSVILVALHWTLSSLSIMFFALGGPKLDSACQTWAQKWGTGGLNHFHILLDRLLLTQFRMRLVTYITLHQYLHYSSTEKWIFIEYLLKKNWKEYPKLWNADKLVAYVLCPINIYLV